MTSITPTGLGFDCPVVEGTVCVCVRVSLCVCVCVCVCYVEGPGGAWGGGARPARPYSHSYRETRATREHDGVVWRSVPSGGPLAKRFPRCVCVSTPGPRGTPSLHAVRQVFELHVLASRELPRGPFVHVEGPRGAPLAVTQAGRAEVPCLTGWPPVRGLRSCRHH